METATLHSRINLCQDSANLLNRDRRTSILRLEYYDSENGIDILCQNLYLNMTNRARLTMLTHLNAPNLKALR